MATASHSGISYAVSDSVAVAMRLNSGDDLDAVLQAFGAEED